MHYHCLLGKCMIDQTKSGKFKVMKTQYSQFSIHLVIHPLGLDCHLVFIFAFAPTIKNPWRYSVLHREPFDQVQLMAEKLVFEVVSLARRTFFFLVPCGYLRATSEVAGTL